MKKFALILACILAVGIFAGCGNNADVSTTGGVDTSFTDIQQKGKLVVGLDVAFPPMGFQDESGEIVGFDIDIAKAVGEKMGVEVELKPIDWKAKEMELNSKKIDVIWNGYTITDERKEQVDFTEPYLNNRQIIITPVDSDIKSKADLAGKKIGYQTGSTAEDAMKADEDVYKTIEANLMGYDDNNTAMMDLKAGRTAAVVVDEVVGKYYLSKNPGLYVILEDNFGDEEYGVGVRKGETALLTELNKGIEAVKADGTFDKISQKWFGNN